MQELYRRIRTRREELNMTQDELAKRLGYKSRSSINKIERGLNDIPQSKVERFAQALNTTPDYLMGWGDSASVNDEQALIEGYRHLNGDGRRVLMTMLGSLRTTHAATV